MQSDPDDRFLLQPDFLRGISALEEFNLAYDILIYPKHLPVAAEFVDAFLGNASCSITWPSRLSVAVKSIRGRKASIAWRLSQRALQTFGTGYRSRLAALAARQIVPFLDVAFESFGPDRLMIGSDWPVCLVAASNAKVNVVKYTSSPQNYSEMQRSRPRRNARRFWRLGAR